MEPVPRSTIYEKAAPMRPCVHAFCIVAGGYNDVDAGIIQLL